MEKRLTPIQELIEQLKVSFDNATEQARIFKREGLQQSMITSEAMALGYKYSMEKAEGLLKKEKESFEEAYRTGFLSDDIKLASEYYNEKFNSK